MSHKRPSLRDENILEQAEQVLQDWAGQFADADMDTEAAEALRAANALLHYRCGIAENLKAKT